MLTTRYHLDEAHLKHYDERLKSWALSQPVKTLPSSLYPWTLTEKAGAVTCWPVGGTPLKPVVDFLFTEVPPASGDKGPENPSTIAGVSSVKATRCGKNLLTRNPILSTMPQRGITVTYNADGSIHLSGTASSSSLPYLRFFTVEPGIVPSILTAGTTLTVSLTCSDSRVYCALYDSDSPTLWGDATIIYPGTPVTHTMSANVKTANLSMVVTRGAVIDCDVYCQIEFGQSATAWEAPADEDYTLPLGSTFYGGTLDVASGVMTVTHSSINSIYCSGADQIGSSGYANARAWPGSYVDELGNTFDVGANTRFTACCSIAPWPNVFTNELIRWYVGGVNSSNAQRPIWFSIHKSLLDFSAYPNREPEELSALEVRNVVNSYLAAHPFLMVVKRDVPYTVQLSPTSISSLAQSDKYTPRLNTVYTDASSVQAGYVKSPIREEYELTQAIVGQGGEI